jgi:hypothetical protein
LIDKYTVSGCPNIDTKSIIPDYKIYYYDQFVILRWYENKKKKEIKKRCLNITQQEATKLLIGMYEKKNKILMEQLKNYFIILKLVILD